MAFCELIRCTSTHHPPPQTCEAVYNTRMRIYQSGRDADTFAVVFRPTQTQTAEVGLWWLLGCIQIPIRWFHN